MKLNFDQQLAAKYTSASQRIRVLSENWVDRFVFCPNCGQERIDKYPNNQPVADFYCLNCQEQYELKSKQKSVGAKIVDGSYASMIERLTSQNNPNFFFLTYNLVSFEVTNFLVIPKHFFIPDVIEKRKPLAATARRAGWVGCNILLQNIPQAGKIFLVKDARVEPKENVLSEWKKTLFLRQEKVLTAKGWLLDTMRVIDRLNKKEFTLEELYRYEHELGNLHPENRHIKAKIRQQLQILRERGYLDFTARGVYRFKKDL